MRARPFSLNLPSLQMAATLPATKLSQQIAPDSATELAAAVREAYESHMAIYPVGGGTSLDTGLAKRQPGIDLSLANLNRVIDYPARDMTITVEAGITLAALAEILSAERQRLPVDAARPQQATLGGLIATNFSGPRRFGCGTIRDYVIGISAVDGRGTPFKAGGRVVKNVAGYDLCKLLCGSYGTLAVITQITLKLKPIPAATTFLACDALDLDEAERLLAALVSSQVVPTAVELLLGPTWQDDPALSPLADSASRKRQRPELVGSLLIGLEGTPAEVDWMASQLRQEWRHLGAGGIHHVAQETVPGLWQRLTDFPCGEPGEVVLKANLLPSCVCSFIAKLLSVAPSCSIEAHAASGIVLARIAGLSPSEATQAILKKLQPAALAAGGNLVVLSSPEGVEPTRRVIWGPAPAEAALMQSVKDQFDPRGLLNPGRFVYGKS